LQSTKEIVQQALFACLELPGRGAASLL